MNPLFAISPVDGRYSERTKGLQNVFSEFGLIRYRLVVMCEWVISLNKFLGGRPRDFTNDEIVTIRTFADINEPQAALVKAIEMEGTDVPGLGKVARTNHDVKACEIYLRSRFKVAGLDEFLELIHFGGTSEDVNNLAYGLMLRAGTHEHLIPQLTTIATTLRRSATVYAHLPMIARTHGQPASPTTLGKELNVFLSRLERQIASLRDYRILVKLNGASGNYNAFVAAFPTLDWPVFTRLFVKRLEEIGGTDAFEPNMVTTQIEPHDTYAELFGIIMRTNTILIDMCQDIWRYVSDGWFAQQPDGVGSSTMPHKVNPIDFENGEGNLGLANAIFGFFCGKLPISRLQRDLSDSTVERNFGYAYGLCVVGYSAIKKGLGRVFPNETVIKTAVNDAVEVLAEAYQTVLRRENYSDPYTALKKFTQGHDVSMTDMHSFIDSLAVPDAVKDELRAFTPQNYIGIAPELARMQ
jgi:adenylosuccinate lyase